MASPKSTRIKGLLDSAGRTSDITQKSAVKAESVLASLEERDQRRADRAQALPTSAGDVGAREGSEA